MIEDLDKEELEKIKTPSRVEIHTYTTDCVNLHEFRSFLIEKGLDVGVYQTHHVQLEYFEVEFYNKDNLLIDVLTCPYGPPIGESNDK